MSDAKTGLKAFAQGRSDIHRVDPRVLFIKPNWNMREESPELSEHIDMLAQSIAEIGVKEPITVRLEDSKLWVINGHCRTRACMRAIEHYGADIKTVPVQAEDRYSNDADLILSQIVRNSGKPLTIPEQARVYKKLLDMGLEQSQIAKKVGLSGGRVSQILNFNTMPQSVQQHVINGNISPSLAQQTVQAASDPGVAEMQVQQAVNTAKSEGRKVKPNDLGSTKGNPLTICKDAFENSEIDCSDEVVETGVVHVTMPIEDWNKIRELFKL